MKKSILKILNITLALLLIAAMLVGCSKGGSDKEQSSVANANPVPPNLIGQISISGYITDVNDSRLNDYVLEFNSQYNNVDVKVTAEQFEDDYFAELDSKIENGTIGDVFLIDDVRMAKYASEGKILDLTPYVQEYMDYDEAEVIHPSNELIGAAYESSLYNGNLYMGAMEYYHKFIFVNYDVLSAAGISAPSDTWSWADLRDYAETIKASNSKEIDESLIPLAMDYNDYSIWGAFARSLGDSIYANVGNTESMALNLTSPEIISGFEGLADLIGSGYVEAISADDIEAEELSNYAFVVADHTNLLDWKDYLLSNECKFNWDYMHFPRWSVETEETEDGEVATETESDEEGEEKPSYYQSIGAKSYGFAVLVRDESYNQEHYDMCAQLALYGLVDDASEKYSADGSVVPANIDVNAQRFWRDYPVEGKNTSVFSHYAETADFATSLTSIMPITSANEIYNEEESINAVKTIIDDYLNKKVPFEDSLQKLQDKVNAAWH